MITLLIDYNIEGQAALLWSTWVTEGWVAVIPTRFVQFADVQLEPASPDRLVWTVAQAQQLIILTANRNMDGDDSLEQVMRDSNQPDSLPLITISAPDRMVEVAYRVRCAARLAEILVYLPDYRGSGRLFIP